MDDQGSTRTFLDAAVERAVDVHGTASLALTHVPILNGQIGLGGDGGGAIRVGVGAGATVPCTGAAS